MIRLENVHKTYQGNKAVVENISLHIKEGEHLVLLGTSGSGKTTLLRMMNRLLKPTSGKIWIENRDIDMEPPPLLRRKLGYVIQQHGLFPHYTVAENIGLVPKLLRWKKQQIRERTAELMDKFHIPYQELKDTLPAHLSGGQKQRVGLARALAANPPILLMDEPFGALDPITRNNIRQELAQSDEFKRKTVVMVTHDIEEAIAFADRICLLHEGKVQQLDTPIKLLLRPANMFVQNFFHDKRFELELKAVKIAELWPYLNPSPLEDLPAHQETLTSETSAWTAFTLLIEQDTAIKLLLIEKNNKVRYIGHINALIQAFQQYKSDFSQHAPY